MMSYPLAMKLFFASNNDHKLLEMRELFPGWILQSPKEKGIISEPVEDGANFYQNALIKARALFEVVACPVLADDSGLCVDALHGQPGIFSARYGEDHGKKLDQTAKNNLIIERLGGSRQRGCRFICCLVLMLSKDRIYSIQESCEGLIDSQARGVKGFGYDPIFYIPELGKTMAELSQTEKNRISHRGRAARSLLNALMDKE